MNHLLSTPIDEVALQPCQEFRPGITDDGLVCEVCGWLTDEHDASVTALPRPSAFPTRRAS